MKAASLFVLQTDIPSGFSLTNETYIETAIVNNVEERLTTQLFVNEDTRNGYQHCSVVADEIIDITARVLQQNINQIIIQNKYDAYFNKSTGSLIVLSGKKIADRVKEIFKTKFNLCYEKHEFNMEEIINNASNVRGVRFKDLTIETIRNGVLTGNRVDQTELYELMLNNGTLYNTTVKYVFGVTEITFSVSNTGSIVLFSNMEDVQYLDLLDELREL